MAKSAGHALLPPRFLFRFSAPLNRCDVNAASAAAKLGDAHQLIDFGELDGARHFADIRAGWSPAGVVMCVRVDGKRQPPWCRDSQLEESDGLQVWIDTRDTHNIHRASKYCHRFVFLPRGGGRDYERPVADQLLINRARENARPVRPRELEIEATVRASGYALSVFIPAIALEGYDTSEYRRLGFQYAVVDRELGLQTFSCGRGMPYEEDPSLWGSLELVDG